MRLRDNVLIVDVVQAVWLLVHEVRFTIESAFNLPKSSVS